MDAGDELRPGGDARAPFDAGGEFSADSRSGFDDVRQALAATLVREPDSLMLARPSLALLLAAMIERAELRRSSLGLVGFELEDWKRLQERAGEHAFAAGFAGAARELRRRVRTTDELGRLGEAKIALVLPGCDPQFLGSVLERVRLSIDGRELDLGDARVRVSFSGAAVAAYPRKGPRVAAQLLAELETALANAGASG